MQLKSENCFGAINGSLNTYTDKNILDAFIRVSWTTKICQNINFVVLSDPELYRLFIFCSAGRRSNLNLIDFYEKEKIN